MAEWWEQDRPAEQAQWWNTDPVMGVQQSLPGPREQIEDREIARQDVQRQIGGPFDFDAGAPGFLLRADLARADNPEERRLKLESALPGVEVRDVTTPTGPLTVFRPQGEPAFRAIDEAGLSLGDAGDVAGSLVNEENLAALVAALVTRGMSLPARIGVQTITGGAGRVTRSGVEAARGQETDPLSEIFGQAGVSAVSAGAGEGLGTAASKILNPLRGGGLLEPLPGVKQAQQAAREEGLPPLSVGQANPLAERKENQAAMTSQVIPAYRGEQRAAVSGNLAGRADDLGGALPDDELERVMRAQADDLYASIRDPNVPLRDGGKALQQGTDEFRRKSREWVKRKYDAAESVSGGVGFDLTPTQSLLDELAAPVTARAADGGEAQVNKGATGELASIVETLRGLSPDVVDTESATAVNQLRAIRSRLRDIKEQDWQTADANTRQDIRMASRLYDSITETLANPKGGSEEFTRLWSAANKANTFREGVLNTATMRKITAEESPEVLAERYAAPGQTTNLRLLKRVMPSEKWGAFKDSYRTRLLAEPGKINKALDDFAKDKDALNLLFSPVEQRELRAFGSAVSALDSSTMKKVFADQNTAGKRAIALLDGGGQQELADLIKKGGGPDSPFGRNMRAGVFQSILDKATVTEKGAQTLDPQRAITLIDEYVESGRLRGVLLPSDIRALTNLRSYLSAIGRRGDAGAGIQGAEIASGAFDFTNPSRLGTSWLAAGRNAFYARALTNPKIARYLTGEGDKALRPLTSIRAVSTVASLMLADDAKSSERGSLPQ